LSKLVQMIRRGPGFCQYREMKYPKKWDDDRPDNVCPLCNQQFVVGDQCYMVITYKLFPNTVIHKSCVDTDFLITTHALIKSYDRFKKAIKENKGWCEECLNQI
jgi:hypothetical protein